eukprot:TRINITY_DN8398_c0_g1_i1.p3 TRINITY_DN8398_c0_g1~~TRINITY_DN8398_c0_g1_i1.p3  ORF type:complete len:155 (-),score=8.38 TRINITY_DN8398_c0_g1_i1:158-622(-)
MPVSVTINPDLMRQLREENGFDTSTTEPSTTGHTRAPNQGVPSYFSQLDPETAMFIRRHREVQSALSTSRKVGNLLLKHEEAELAKVRAQAAALLSTKSTQGPKRCCAAEREACTACYAQFPGDELQCTGAVAAYEACARRSQIVHPPEPAQSS